MRKGRSATLLVCSALTAWSLAATRTHAQDGATYDGGLEAIIVTAQKREQNLQDVPIAVTALAGDALIANRVTTVQDLSGMAPGLMVSQAAGSSRIPSFTMRGVVSTGVVAGSDKQVSIYLDGVYISSPKGAVFDLPDVERLEVLRGPQGTLFGRNATAGAVSISTREPTGEVGLNASVTVGNLDHYRFRTSVNLPQIGPLSGYVSYVHNYQRGDIRNLAGGRIVDFRNSKDPKIARAFRSPDHLGTADGDSFFAAVKFESGNFVTTYKYDLYKERGTPRGTGLVGYDTNNALLHTLITTQPIPVPIVPNGKRPDAVSNGWATPFIHDNQGHSVTSTYWISDALQIKNIFGFRKSYVFAVSPLDAVSSLIITPEVGQMIPSFAPLVGEPFLGIIANPQSRSEQISDELQLNYDTDFLTATAGALWFESKDWINEHMLPPNSSFAPLPGGTLLNRTIGVNFNKAVSIAGYAQLEFHPTSQLDFILGGRLTRDRKSGYLQYGPNPEALTQLGFRYKDTKFNYLLGVNYKPNDNTLVYAKYSTAYVSGGSVVGIGFEPETVKSWEAGVKAELFDRRLRTNLALFHAKYKHAQGPNSSTTPGACDFIFQQTGDPTRCAIAGSFVADLGDIKAQGFEIDVDAAPVEGVTLGGNLGYTDAKLTRVNPLLLNAAPGGVYGLPNRPKWVGGGWAQYDTPPFGSGDTYLSFRGDARYQSSMSTATYPLTPSYRTWASGILEVPSYWLFNARVALKNLNLGGVDTELAVWGKNLSNERHANYGLNLGVIAAANYIPARTYGMDLNISF